MALFTDRHDAGRRLAQEVRQRLDGGATVVLALPRGGVPVGFEVARELGCPLDVFLVKKLGVPGHEELAMGAIASGGVRILNRDVIAALDIPERVLDIVTERARGELEGREMDYRSGRAPLPLSGKTVIIVDDGLATGASMRAAITAVRHQMPARVIAGVPIAPAEGCAALMKIADEVICAETPHPFFGVGQWYSDFSQTPDEEVRALLEQAREIDLRQHERTEGHAP